MVNQKVEEVKRWPDVAVSVEVYDYFVAEGMAGLDDVEILQNGSMFRLTTVDLLFVKSEHLSGSTAISLTEKGKRALKDFERYMREMN